MVKVNHYWFKVEDKWFIGCKNADDSFSPQGKCFIEQGICPFCRGQAKNELEIAKRIKEEEERREGLKEEVKKKNTIGGWI